MLPLLHWLPPRWYRAILRRIGPPFFASEANLNLLSRRDLDGLARGAGIVDFHIDAVELWALPSNLMLVAPKNLRVGARLAGARLKHPEATMIE